MVRRPRSSTSSRLASRRSSRLSPRSALAAVLGMALALSLGVPATAAVRLAEPVTAGALATAVEPLGAVLVGSLQSEIGCPGDWQPDCRASELRVDPATGLATGTFTLPAGSFEYKIAVGGSWDVSYGAGGSATGGNIALVVPAQQQVTFWFDPVTHAIADSISTPMAVVRGDLQRLLGCSEVSARCLKTRLTDPDGDGVLSYTTDALPAGSYTLNVAVNGSDTQLYPSPGYLTVVVKADADPVTVTYALADQKVTATSAHSGSVQPGDEALARHSLRDAPAGEKFYFVMADRFANGSTANDTGGYVADRLTSGFDPTDKGFYHGGDLKGLTSRLDYVKGLGTTAIWLTPSFVNKPVQGTGADVSAGYHGYWITDFTRIDPHFGTNADMRSLIRAAHAKGMKVYFDIITNHTADVISYTECSACGYRSKGAYPYVDASGREFDDRSYINGTFPTLDVNSFPYTPFVAPQDRRLKTPRWLNDVTLYHNRGNTTYTGENSTYGDFSGLDDLFTENPKVVKGFEGVYDAWMDFGVDGFRIDTVKHVNLEFWQQFAPHLQAHATAGGKTFFAFGEVFSGDPKETSVFTTQGRLQAVLDFPFQAAARSFAAGGTATGVADTFAQDDRYTDADSNAYALPTFLGNHDMGRIGTFLRQDVKGASSSELLARDELAHALMYLSRGNPVVYYGDEQGFTGAGGDKDARQDMFPTQTQAYKDPATNALIGSDRAPGGDSFDTSTPLYQSISRLAALTAAHPTLRSGAQVQRLADGNVLAFSRIAATGADAGVEYVVALNSGTSARTVTVPTGSPSTGFQRIYPATGSAATGSTRGLSVEVPALGAVVLRADKAQPVPSSGASVRLTPPPAGAEVVGPTEIGATVTGSVFGEVTFAARAVGQSDWTVLGTDDAAPYRVYADLASFGKGTKVELRAVARDLGGNLNGDSVEVTVGAPKPTPPPGAPTQRDHLVVHYARGGSYDGWGLHVWGDTTTPTDWAKPLPFAGEDSYGRFAWVPLTADASTVSFIVHNGDLKDPDGNRTVNPQTAPEIWLRSGDATIYTSEVAATGHVRVHYSRPDKTYDGWGLHLWGDAVDTARLPHPVDWAHPLEFTGTDAFGAYADVPVKEPTAKIGFILHRGDVKDPEGDRFITPAEHASVWLVSGESTIYGSQAAAEHVAVIHYNRPDGAYGPWKLYVWDGSAVKPDWPGLAPTGADGFGSFWRVPLAAGATALSYIINDGSAKDPGSDQSLDLAGVGTEVWFISGSHDSSGKATYLLPVLGGAGPDLSLDKAKAVWVDRSTVAWKVEPNTSHGYSLRFDPAGGITADGAGVVGGRTIRLDLAPNGLTAEQKATHPELVTWAAFTVRPADQPLVRRALRGQVVAVDRDGNGALRAATGVQLAGAIDDLYGAAAKRLVMGPQVTRFGVLIRVFAPTAQNVVLLLDPAKGGGAPSRLSMWRDEASGSWLAAGPRTWTNRSYRFEVTVWAPSVQKVVTNVVTDPYSLGLTVDSTRSVLVDLTAPAGKPAGWDRLAKPTKLVDDAIYELHVRDFSIGDTTVPAAERGTYLAFAQRQSAGMKHLTALSDAGLSTVHLLPVFDIATIPEKRSEQATPACDLPSLPRASDQQQECVSKVAATDGYNWGYDPYHYTTPEGSYSTAPDGITRTQQFRTMVANLNQTHLNVVMDVVYNHTSAAGQAPTSVLDQVVPGYYQRLDANGAVQTSTCCSNTATEHVMMNKLVVDSVVTWAKAYKIDGFRFDLMGHLPKSTLLDVRAALDSLTVSRDGVDGRRVYLYGEGWDFGEVANNALFTNATQLNMAGTGVGTFNDRLRDGVRGGSPFTDRRVQGFATGLATDDNGAGVNGDDPAAGLRHSTDLLQLGLAGNLADYRFTSSSGAVVSGRTVDYNGAPAGYTAQPHEAITYVDAHDNETLFDALTYKLPRATSMADRVRMNTLALSTTALSQGVTFWHAGTELLRSKSLDTDSYDSGDWFNRLDASMQTNGFGGGLPPKGKNGDLWPIMTGLLADRSLSPAPADITRSDAMARDLLRLRASTRLFHLGSAALVQQKVSFPLSGPAATPGVVVMRIDDTTGPDVDPRLRGVVVVFNATPKAQTAKVAALQGQGYTLSSVQALGSDSVVKKASASGYGSFSVPARTVAVFVSPQRDRVS